MGVGDDVADGTFGKKKMRFLVLGALFLVLVELGLELGAVGVVDAEVVGAGSRYRLDADSVAGHFLAKRGKFL